MRRMNKHHEFKPVYFFWLFASQVNTNAINNIMIKEDSKMAPVSFRWSGGFELNYQKIRCAIDQSSEDPSNLLLEVFPEMKDDVYFPEAPDESQRYNCDSNSSLFLYDPQTRRIHQVDNGHCLVVNRKARHYVASTYYPTIPVLKSIDCKRTTMNDSTARVIWGNEFRLIHSNSTINKMVVRFIAPEDGHQWTIYIRVNILIVANQTQEAADDLEEPSLEVIHDNMPFIQKTN